MFLITISLIVYYYYSQAIHSIDLLGLFFLFSSMTEYHGCRATCWYGQARSPTSAYLYLENLALSRGQNSKLLLPTIFLAYASKM